MPSNATKQNRGGVWVAGQFALLAAILLAPRRLPGVPEWPEPVRSPLGVVGLLLSLAGGAMAVSGAKALGHNLTPFPRPIADGDLVQDGIYGVVRHPIYSGILLGAFGWSLLRASTPSLLLGGLLALFFDRKARREEQWLREQYPGYDAYTERVRRRVW